MRGFRFAEEGALQRVESAEEPHGNDGRFYGRRRFPTSKTHGWDRYVRIAQSPTPYTLLCFRLFFMSIDLVKKIIFSLKKKSLLLIKV